MFLCSSNNYILFCLFSFAEANEWSQVYGIILMPVAIAFCLYALWMYIKRAGMIRRKDPGPCNQNIPCLNEKLFSYFFFLIL